MSTTKGKAGFVDPENWVGVMAPYITYIFAFNLRMKELRLGHSGYSKPKKPEETRSKDSSETFGKVSEFRLDSRHHVLLEGCTYPPEVQSSMPQTLGAMTVCMKLDQFNTASKYTKKY